MSLTPKPVSDDEIIKVSQFFGVSVQKIKDKHPDFACSVQKCDCGHSIGFFDFVKTAFLHGVHDKSYMSEFFSSKDSMDMDMDVSIVCSICDKIENAHVMYKYSGPRPSCGGGK